MRNSKGPKTVPCGTLERNSFCDKILPHKPLSETGSQEMSYPILNIASKPSSYHIHKALNAVQPVLNAFLCSIIIGNEIFSCEYLLQQMTPRCCMVWSSVPHSQLRSWLSFKYPPLWRSTMQHPMPLNPNLPGPFWGCSVSIWSQSHFWRLGKLCI